MSIVYRATFPNGKKYIGYTNNTLEHRINQHKNDIKRSNSIVRKAFRKYGFENVIWETIAEFDSPEEGLMMEEAFIYLENTMIPNGYNTFSGGEDIQKQSIEYYSNPDNLLKHSEIQSETYSTPEMREVQRQRAIEEWKNPITRKQICNKMRENRNTNEYRNIRSKLSKEFYNTEEGKLLQKKRSLDFYKSIKGVEFKKKNNQQQKEFFKTKEGIKLKEIISKKNKEFYASEKGKECIKRNSLKLKQFYQTEEGKKKLLETKEKIRLVKLQNKELKLSQLSQSGVQNIVEVTLPSTQTLSQ